MSKPGNGQQARAKSREDKLDSAIKTIIELEDDKLVLERKVDELEARVAGLEKELHKAENKNFALQSQLRRNTLTGLTNRHGLEEIMVHLEAFVETNTFTGMGCYVGIDLDGFKGVNDRYGHDVGDEVLKYFAMRLTEKVSQREVHSENRVPIMAETLHPSGDEYGILVIEAVATDLRNNVDRRKSSSTDMHDRRGSKSDRRGDKDRLRREIAELMVEIKNEIAENPLVLEGTDGPIQITHGVSFGIGMFSNPDVDSIRKAQIVADEAMFKDKCGLGAFMKCYEVMSPQLQEFARDLMGDRLSTEISLENIRDLENEIGMAAYILRPDFATFVNALDKDALKWAFPELARSRSQPDPQMYR